MFGKGKKMDFHKLLVLSLCICSAIALGNGASLEDMTDFKTDITTGSKPGTIITDSPQTTSTNPIITESSPAPPGTSESTQPSTATPETSMSTGASISSDSPTTTVPPMTSDHTSSMEPTGSSNTPANSSTVSTGSSPQPTSPTGKTTASTQTSSETTLPPSPTTTPKPQGRRFDAGSFVGGIVLGMVLLLIGFLIYRCIKVRRGKEQYGYGRVQ